MTWLLVILFSLGVLAPVVPAEPPTCLVPVPFHCDPKPH